MQKEVDAEVEASDESFKNLVFANNPKMYHSLFVQPEYGYDEQTPTEADIRLPETVGDVMGLLADLKEFGIDLDNTEV